MPTLTIQLPGLPPVEHIVREDAITLGRMKGNSIALSDPSVSLSHAKITRIGNDFFLKDLNSTNGTMLNGQSITEARLREGDQLKFGEVVAYFRLEPLSPPVAEPVPSPKPVAQSVPMPMTAPAAIVSASVASAPAPRQTAAPLSAARRTSLRRPLSILGGVAVLAAAAMLAWKFFPHAPLPVASVGAAVVAAPKPVPAPSTNVPPAPARSAVEPPRDPNLEPLLKALKSPDVVARRHAASAIYNLGPAAKDALPVLPDALTDADPDVRMWVALTLVHNNVFEKGTIPILVQTLHHENSTLRQVACLSLAMIPYSEADKQTVITALVDAATKDASPDVASDATTALKIIAPDLAVGK